MNYKREIAALEFLLGIPMAAEGDIVHQGWLKQHGLSQDENSGEERKVDPLELPHAHTRGDTSLSSHHGRWWEKWIAHSSKLSDMSRRGIEEGELEQPHQIEVANASNREKQFQDAPQQVVPLVHAPGRRLEGDDAIRIQIPMDVNTSTRQKHIARLAATREWELEVAHGIGLSSATPKDKNPKNQKQSHPPMLDGRMFFSASESYPTGVFSIIRYEPRKEEAARRRQKLEARGGGGTQFIMPTRDWRGISYRALLPIRSTRRKGGPDDEEAMIFFDRFATSNSENEHRDSEGDNKRHLEETETKSLGLTDDDDSDDEVDTYVPGLLDDPEMVLGRHRNVMIGDRTTGCIISSMIQFVKPALLKADLNKKFKERFDGWEPPKSQRKYIGARVIDGVYTLMEPGLDDSSAVSSGKESERQGSGTGTTAGTKPTTPRSRLGSVSSLSSVGDPKETIRMPPSLTLSKIRSLKRQALLAAVKARLEISTVALAIVYFERLCLDCRVDKTNRRLSFAACLLLAIKINEAHVGLATPEEKEEPTASKNLASIRIQSVYRPTEKSSSMFASLLEVFTQEWEISLKHLYAAEWGVFAALQFRLHAKPSQVAFHFKRLLKSLDWNPRTYLGSEMFNLWQAALAREEYLRQEHEVRIELRQQKKEQKQLMQLQLEISRREKSSLKSDSEGDETDRQTARQVSPARAANAESGDIESQVPSTLPPSGHSHFSPRKTSRISLGLLNRFGAHGKRSHSSDKLSHGKRSHSSDKLSHAHGLQSGSGSSNHQMLSSSPSMPSLSTYLNNDERGASKDGKDEEMESSHSDSSVIMI